VLPLTARVLKLDCGSLIVSSLKHDLSRFDTADVSSVVNRCEDILFTSSDAFQLSITPCRDACK